MNEMKFFHETPLQIRFNDVDVMGHVNNSVYQNYFDVARLRYSAIENLRHFQNHVDLVAYYKRMLTSAYENAMPKAKG